MRMFICVCVLPYDEIYLYSTWNERIRLCKKNLSARLSEQATYFTEKCIYYKLSVSLLDFAREINSLQSFFHLK